MIKNASRMKLFQIGINAGLRGTDLLRLGWLDVLTEEGQIKKVIELNESPDGLGAQLWHGVVQVGARRLEPLVHSTRHVFHRGRLALRIK